MRNLKSLEAFQVCNGGTMQGKGFSVEESTRLCAHQLSTKKPFKNFQVGTRAWVLGVEARVRDWVLKLEVYHSNLSGTNRYLVIISKSEYLKFFEDHGYCPESPAPKIGPM